MWTFCYIFRNPILQNSLEYAFRLKDCNQEESFFSTFQGSSGEQATGACVSCSGQKGGGNDSLVCARPPCGKSLMKDKSLQHVVDFYFNADIKRQESLHKYCRCCPQSKVMQPRAREGTPAAASLQPAAATLHQPPKLRGPEPPSAIRRTPSSGMRASHWGVEA